MNRKAKGGTAHWGGLKSRVSDEESEETSRDSITTKIRQSFTSAGGLKSLGASWRHV
jgi:hypothetical protein